MVDDPDPEVPARAQRRRYSAGYKQRILAEYEAADRAGRGALLRREGLYTSLISAWREQRDQGALAALGKPAGRPAMPGIGSWLGCGGRTSGWPRSWTRPGP